MFQTLIAHDDLSDGNRLQNPTICLTAIGCRIFSGGFHIRYIVRLCRLLRFATTVTPDRRPRKSFWKEPVWFYRPETRWDQGGGSKGRPWDTLRQNFITA